MINKQVGKAIKDLRIDRDLTQETLSEKCDVSTDAISRIETGKYSPSLNTLWKLCQGLDVSLQTLMAKAEKNDDSVIYKEILDFLPNLNQDEAKKVFQILRILFKDE